MPSSVSAPRAQAAYWLIVLPAVLMLVALYLVPLGDVLVTSVTDPKPGLDNYAPALHQRVGAKDADDDGAHRRHHDVLRVAAGLCRGLRHARGDLARGSGMMLFCVLLPFWISVLVRSFAWLTLLGGQGRSIGC